MKGFIAVLLLLLLGGTAWNAWQIRELKQEIAGLQRNLQQETEARKADDLLARANGALQDAKTAIAGMDAAKAQSALATARQRLADAAKYANEKAAPTISWLERQAADLSKQVQERMNSKAR
jgi:hypothetical protein